MTATGQQSVFAQVYGQCRPSPKFLLKLNYPDHVEKSRQPELGLRVSREWLRDQLTKPQGVGSRPAEGAPSKGMPLLDKNTLHWKTWIGDGAVVEPGGDEAPPDLNHMYKLTQAEFKRLSEQVRDVSENLRNKFRTAAYKRVTDRKSDSEPEVPDMPPCSYHTCDGRETPGILNQKNYHIGRCSTPPPSNKISINLRPQSPSPTQRAYNGTGNGSQLYRSQLAASLKAFQHKTWLPYQPDQNSEGCVPTRLRPAVVNRDQNRPASVKSSASRSQLTPPKHHARPPRSKSVPPYLQHQYNYDSLTPEITAKLSCGQNPESVYGDKVTCTEDQKEKESPSLDGTTGLSSKNTSSASSICSDREDLDDSDDEAIPEPTLESVMMEKVPSLLLRPETVDSMYIPEPKGDRAKYDFDAERTTIPSYDFPYPFSEAFQSVDFREVALSERYWKEFVKPKKPVNKIEEKILERVLEFERLQKKTEEWESFRKDRTKSAVRRSGRNSAASSRAVSAKARDKRCCQDCLQPACVGDCPIKKMLYPESNLCLICREKGCSGNCTQTAYNGRMRQERPQEAEDNKSRPGKLSRPRTTASYQTKTMTRLNNSYIPPTPLRPMTSRNGSPGNTHIAIKPREILLTGNLPGCPNIEKDMHSLDLEPTVLDKSLSSGEKHESNERPNTGSRRPPRGRAALIPGKSYFSQRRNSLTDVSQEEPRAKTAGPKRRSRSAKVITKRRPKTAS